MQMRISTLLICPVIAATAACGGGGGGDDNPPSYSGPTRTVAITGRASADTVVSDTVCVLFTCGAHGGATSNRMALPRALDPLPRSETTDCPQGGAKTLTESDDNFYAVGHTSTVEYDRCAQYSRIGGVLLDGSFSAEVIAVSGAPLESVEWSFTHRGQYDRYRFDMLDGSGRSRGFMLRHGDVVSTYRSGSGELDRVVEDRYPELYAASDFGAPMETLVREARLLTERSSTSDRMVIAQEGGLCSTKIGGCVTLLTPTSFNFPDGLAFAPDAGQMVITAADGARVRVTVVDATQVTIEYDVDPVDGTYEASRSTTWETF